MSRFADLFRPAYEQPLWQSLESRSGPGSTLEYTKMFRTELVALVRSLGARSFLDAPCGDWNWMQHVDFGDIDYIGGDVVPEIVRDLKAKFPGKDFRVIDVVNDAMPEADFWMCRDLLFHLSNEDIKSVLRNAQRSNIKWFASSHYHTEHNAERGSNWDTFRCINLMAAPFNLPKTEIFLNDTGNWSLHRELRVWTIEQLRSIDL